MTRDRALCLTDPPQVSLRGPSPVPGASSCWSEHSPLPDFQLCLQIWPCLFHAGCEEPPWGARTPEETGPEMRQAGWAEMLSSFSFLCQPPTRTGVRGGQGGGGMGGGLEKEFCCRYERSGGLKSETSFVLTGATENAVGPGCLLHTGHWLSRQ